MTAQESALCGWDLTINAMRGTDQIDAEDVKVFARTHFKHWCFQLEKGKKTGYLHFQFRGSLRKRARLCGIKKYLAHADLQGYPSITTVDEFEGDNLYVMKEDETHVEGPWSDKDADEVMYIPKDLRFQPTWNPMQARIIWQMEQPPNRRHVNCIVDREGNRGKSFLAAWLYTHGKANYIPFFAEAKDLMRMVFALPWKDAYFIDLPRAISHKAEHEIYGGIEQLKTGIIYEDRYAFRMKAIDAVHVFVFTNKLPNTSLCSMDR